MRIQNRPHCWWEYRDQFSNNYQNFSFLNPVCFRNLEIQDENIHTIYLYSVQHVLMVNNWKQFKILLSKRINYDVFFYRMLMKLLFFFFKLILIHNAVVERFQYIFQFLKVPIYCFIYILKFSIFEILTRLYVFT